MASRSTSAPPAAPPPLRRATLRLGEADPSRFLRLGEGLARGFWGRGERWVAWWDELASFPVDGGARAEGQGFADRLRREVLRRLAPPPGGWAAVPAAERPRLFGGMPFLAAAGEDGLWTAFGGGRFVLPRVMLEARPDGFRLVAHTAAPDEERFEEELERIAEVLGRPGPGEDASGPEGAAHAPTPESELPFDPVDRARWDDAVREILAREAAGELEKAVLARVLDVAFPQPPDPARALHHLRLENPRAHVFLLEMAPGHVFLGAAPEILTEVRGSVFRATAVAGSAPRGADEAEDARLGESLLRSAKDGAEHALTADDMREVLEGRLEGMEVEGAPHLLRLSGIQHLETRIRGRAREGEDALSLVEALHPTPAVCGRPRERALQIIREREPFERGWYAGPVGWFDPAGDGDFVPALRSAVGGGRRWRLFAGAGIVPGSDPESEWEETALKLEPALRALRAGVRGSSTP